MAGTAEDAFEGLDLGIIGVRSGVKEEVEDDADENIATVSYTHLTLPTMAVV